MSDVEIAENVIIVRTCRYGESFARYSRGGIQRLVGRLTARPVEIHYSAHGVFVRGKGLFFKSDPGVNFCDKIYFRLRIYYFTFAGIKGVFGKSCRHELSVIVQNVIVIPELPCLGIKIFILEADKVSYQHVEYVFFHHYFSGSDVGVREQVSVFVSRKGNVTSVNHRSHRYGAGGVFIRIIYVQSYLSTLLENNLEGTVAVAVHGVNERMYLSARRIGSHGITDTPHSVHYIGFLSVHNFHYGIKTVAFFCIGVHSYRGEIFVATPFFVSYALSVRGNENFGFPRYGIEADFPFASVGQ